MKVTELYKCIGEFQATLLQFNILLDKSRRDVLQLSTTCRSVSLRLPKLLASVRKARHALSAEDTMYTYKLLMNLSKTCSVIATVITPSLFPYGNSQAVSKHFIDTSDSLLSAAISIHCKLATLSDQ